MIKLGENSSGEMVKMLKGKKRVFKYQTLLESRLWYGTASKKIFLFFAQSKTPLIFFFFFNINVMWSEFRESMKDKV